MCSFHCEILDQLVRTNPNSDRPKGTVVFYLTKLAQLGGYLARKNDPPPGNMVIWLGLSRRIDIQLRFLMRSKLVGN